ncbi:MAG: hypothetical protein ACK5OX_08775 [Desertimonas sp.]
MNRGLLQAANYGEQADYDRDMIEAIRGLLPSMAKWPWRLTERNTHRYFEDEFRRPLRDNPSILRAIVWELRRDYGHWPSFRDVHARICTWLEIDAE